MSDWITKSVDGLGYTGIVFLMFLENVFPPIPSELIMPLAGYEAARGNLSLPGVVVAGTLGSVIGQLPFYALGRWAGSGKITRWVDRYGRWIGLSNEDIRKSNGWFEKHGMKAVFFCRFVPGVRSLISIPAGMAGVRLLPFLFISTLGMGIWVAALAIIGSQLGRHYGAVEAYLGPAATTVVCAILLFWIIRGIRNRKRA